MSILTLIHRLHAWALKLTKAEQSPRLVPMLGFVMPILQSKIKENGSIEVVRGGLGRTQARSSSGLFPSVVHALGMEDGGEDVVCLSQ